jgi:hypothetical protein
VTFVPVGVGAIFCGPPGGQCGNCVSAEAFGADDVFAVEALAKAGRRFSGGTADAFGVRDGSEAGALFCGVEDVAAVAPGGWNLGGQVGLLGKEEHWAHLCTIAGGCGNVSTGV